MTPRRRLVAMLALAALLLGGRPTLAQTSDGECADPPPPAVASQVRQLAKLIRDTLHVDDADKAKALAKSVLAGDTRSVSFPVEPGAAPRQVTFDLDAAGKSPGRRVTIDLPGDPDLPVIPEPTPEPPVCFDPEPLPADSALAKYGRDLTAEAAQGQLGDAIGRDDEIEQTMAILLRKQKGNPALVGEPGVGKTAIVEGLARRIVTCRVPKALQGKRIVQLDLTRLVGGTAYRGEFEERLGAVIQQASADPDLVLFVDEMHTLLGAGAANGAAGDAAQALKPALARGELRMIGATTRDEYERYVEKDGALERRFNPVVVAEPTIEQAIAILRGIAPRFAESHEVRYDDAALVAAVKLSARYLHRSALPDKAIDLMDEAGSRAQLAGRDVVTASDVATLVAKKTGIPVDRTSDDDAQRVLGLEARLGARVIGQDEALHQVALAVQRSRTGLADPKRPIGGFLFLGPTGVGKTETARALAADLFDDPDAMTRIDMSEYMEKFSVTRLIGAPPGYVGYEDGGTLTGAVRRKPYSVVLLDEIEKAHPDVWNLLLQVLDDGRLTDSQGRTIDFRNTVVIMTSNVPKDELATTFRPELLNRLDAVVEYRPLESPALLSIVGLEVDKTVAKLAPQGVTLTVTDAAKQLLLDRSWENQPSEGKKIGFAADGDAAPTPKTAVFGARPLRRTIATLVENPISDRLLRKQIVPGTAVLVDARDGTLVFKTKKIVRKADAKIQRATVIVPEPEPEPATVATSADDDPALAGMRALQRIALGRRSFIRISPDAARNAARFSPTDLQVLTRFVGNDQQLVLRYDAPPASLTTRFWLDRSEDPDDYPPGSDPASWLRWKVEALGGQVELSESASHELDRLTSDDAVALLNSFTHDWVENGRPTMGLYGYNFDYESNDFTWYRPRSAAPPG